ncbi:QsdR family transcriptional regulator [Rhodococcus sp. MSC1_016]|jgi:AcrR family transcriptional regulator|uniref:QsdR family transcriptional regulator n=1 Tax=Rhodococcus sp. MSC1_016 TaxID=2909266 RepID=UPI00202FEBB3|nr:QsdR family transcriptional regulator [Rhodococcus sp. MSC1_016]
MSVPRHSSAGYEQAVDAARRKFLAGDRLDMQKLAAELGVNPSTLFRWVGNRDQLLATVLWSLAEPTYRAAMAATTRSGAARIADAAAMFDQALIDAPYFRAFLRREPEHALRLLTTKASPVQQEIVAATERLVQQEMDRGNLVHPMSAHDLAYLIARISEAFVYADIITGESPDAAKAAVAVAALLGDATYVPKGLPS